MKMKNISLWLAAVACLCVPAGCIQEDVTDLDSDRNVSVTMRVQTRAGSEMQAATEDVIRSLRVYAYLGQKQIGRYSTNTVTTNENGVVTFVMDLDLPSFSTVYGDVDFYLAANENAIAAYSSEDVWKEEMTKGELDNYRFGELRSDANLSALPMAIRQSVTIDPSSVIPSTASGHEKHWMVSTPIEFHLERAVAKLGMFFAKKDEGDAELLINSIEVLPQGLRDFNYLFEPTEAQLQGVAQTWQNGFSLLTSPLTVTKTVLDADYDPTLTDPSQLAEQYDDALTQPVYMFENCYGSENDDVNNWGANDTGHKGFVLRVTYTVNGNQSTKDIYLPPTKRNTYYCVLNRIGLDGIVSIVYDVADWTDGGNTDIEWGHPTFSFVAPEGVTDYESHCQIDYNPDFTPVENDPATNLENLKKVGASFIFNMSAPAGQVWAASLSNASDFTLWIDGKKVSSGGNTDQWVADVKDHWLTVTANNANDSAERETELTIKSVMWGEANSSLNINSNQSAKFPGEASYILITQKSNQ